MTVTETSVEPLLALVIDIDPDELTWAMSLTVVFWPGVSGTVQIPGFPPSAS
jgi:hypothetical protein